MVMPQKKLLPPEIEENEALGTKGTSWPRLCVASPTVRIKVPEPRAWEEAVAKRQRVTQEEGDW